MSFRHLLSPILRRFGVSGSTTNSQRMMTRDISVQTNSKSIKETNKEIKSNSIASFDETHVDDQKMSSTMIPTTDILTQQVEPVSSHECENNATKSTNIRRGSISVDDLTKNKSSSVSNASSTTNNNSIKESKSTDELYTTTIKHHFENTSELQKDNKNSSSAEKITSSIEISTKQSKGIYCS